MGVNLNPFSSPSRARIAPVALPPPPPDPQSEFARREQDKKRQIAARNAAKRGTIFSGSLGVQDGSGANVRRASLLGG